MLRNQKDITELGIINTGKIHHNLSVPQLVTEALARGEGKLASTGAFRVETGKYTGRSPNDRFVVGDPEIRDEIDWGKINVPIAVEKFQAIFNRVKGYLQNKDIFIFDAYQRQARDLAQKFVENFKKFKDVPAKIVEAGPKL